MSGQVAGTATDLLKGIEAKPVRTAMEDIFPAVHPRLPEKTALADIFKGESAKQFVQNLTEFSSLLSEDDDFEQTLGKLQGQIDKAEKTRDEVLAKLYQVLRPIEESYRQIWSFFDNSVVPDGKQRQPLELYILNADPAAMKNRESSTLGAIRECVKKRNDNFNFRDDICNLVIPGDISMMIREALEEEAYKWGMLLVTDLDDLENFKRVVDNFGTDGRYEFLKRPDAKAASDVATVGYLKLRDAYWFEKNEKGSDDFYAPASMVFAGALARTDRTRNSVVQGPVGSRFGQIKGIETARIECLLSEMTLLSQEMQVIPIIRDADNRLCFYGCRSLADDKYGVLKFFGSYRVLMYLERSINTRFRDVAGQVLTRDLLDEGIEKPIRRLLEEQMEVGTIMSYKLFVNNDVNLRMQGKCEVDIEVTPTGPAEHFRLKIDVPEFKSEKERSASGN